MAILSNLFGDSPFGAVEAHGEKVHACIGRLKELMDAVLSGDHSKAKEVAGQVFTLESEADAVRNQVHEMLSAKMLLSMRKPDLFNILENQDSMADRAEDVAATLTYRELCLPDNLKTGLAAYAEKVFKVCELESGIMSKLDLLVEASFKGRDALTVSKLITELGEREDALKSEQIELTRQLLSKDSELSPVDAMLWLEGIRHLSDMSRSADRTANGIRLTLEVKHPPN